MNLSNEIEYRMKRILIVGIAVGIVVGIFLTLAVGALKGKDSAGSKVSGKNTQAQSSIDKGKDIVETANLNAKPLSSIEEDWKLTLVNSDHPLATSYKPELVEAEPDRKVDKRILEDLTQMLNDARGEGLNPYICSAYRDYEYQRKVFNDTMVTWIADGKSPLDAYEETARSVAVPGTSEHATGLALDITSAEFPELDERQADTKEAKWLAENCWKYGFILRYPPDKSDITGIIHEPWHYRYVGKEAAKEITERGVTLEEYLEK